MSRTHDLDALLDEIDGNGVTVTLFGREWTLPTDVDAETMLRVQRLQMQVALAKRQGRDVDADAVLDDAVSLDDLVEAMAGPENFAEWRRLGLGYRGMQVIAGKLYAIHSGMDGEQQPGKGASGGRAKRTPTSTGTARSKPGSKRA